MQKTPPTVTAPPGYGDDYNKTFREMVMAYPVDAHCASAAGCDNTVAFHMDYHGCYEELVCAEHLEAWAKQVQTRITVFESVVCMTCMREFTSVLAFATARPA